MAAEPTLKPALAREEELDEIDEREESDIYEEESEEDGDVYDAEEDEDEDGEEGAGEGKPDNMTALLLGKQNGTTETEAYDEEDEEDEEYHDDLEGTEEHPIDLSSVAGSKRGADELAEEDAYDDDDDDEAEGKTVTKKARV